MLKTKRNLDGGYTIAIQVKEHKHGAVCFHITEMNLGMSKPYWVLTNLQGVEILDASTKKALLQYLETRTNEALIRLDA